MLPEREILALHRAITAIRSVSGEEGELAGFLGDLLRRNGVALTRLGSSLLATVGTGPVLLLRHPSRHRAAVAGVDARSVGRARWSTAASMGWARTTPRLRSRR